VSLVVNGFAYVRDDNARELVCRVRYTTMVGAGEGSPGESCRNLSSSEKATDKR